MSSAIRLTQGHIYLIKNVVNGKIYIGQTWHTLDHRWSQHKSGAYHNSKRGCPYLYKAIIKHGADNFTIESISRFDNQQEADIIESQCIDKYQSTDHNHGYNLTKGGQGEGSGSRMLESTRKKISQSRKGQRPSAESRLKMSIAGKLKAQSLSVESQQRLDDSRFRNRKLTMEQAKEIRKEWAEGTQIKILASKWGVSTVAIGGIVHNRTYINDYKPIINHT